LSDAAPPPSFDPAFDPAFDAVFDPAAGAPALDSVG
jgi:hypothetical protein